MGTTPQSVEPQPYDFGVSSRLSREAVVALRKIHSAAGDELEVLLSRAFSEDVRFATAEVSQVRYEAFLDLAPSGSYHAVLASGTLSGQFQASFDPTSTARLLGLIFSSPATDETRSLSLVDARVLESRFGVFAQALNRSFQPFFGLDLTLAKSLVSAKQTKIIDDDETVVMAEVTFNVGQTREDLTLRICYPQDVVTPVLVALSDLEHATAAEALTKDTPIQQSLMRVKLPVSIQLPHWVMDASAVEDLQVGSVIKTGVNTTVPPVLSVAGKPLLDVTVFNNHQRVAAEVVGAHDHRKDNHV